MSDEPKDQHSQHGPQVMAQARPVKISPKAVFWIVLSAGTVAFIGFASILLNAGYRNGWW